MSKFTSIYKHIDKEHNVWQCTVCGHMTQFEVDGPHENGWNVCPVCVTPVRQEAEE